MHHTQQIERNEHGRGATAKRLLTLMVLGASLVASTGCSLIDRLDNWMVENGIVRERLDRTAHRLGIDPEQIVEIKTRSSHGVGVVVEHGYVLTSAHVLDGAESAGVLQHSMVAGAAPFRRTGKVIWSDAERDVCLLDTGERSLTGSMRAPTLGEATLVTLEQTTESQFGDAYYRASIRSVEILPGGRYVMDGQLHKGDSGSPLLQGGHVVGIVRTAKRYAPVSTAVAMLRKREGGGGARVASLP